MYSTMYPITLHDTDDLTEDICMHRICYEINLESVPDSVLLLHAKELLSLASALLYTKQLSINAKLIHLRQWNVPIGDQKK